LVALTTEQRAAYDLLLKQLGPEQLIQRLTKIRPRLQQERRAARKALDEEIRNAVGRILASKGIKPKGRDLARMNLGRDNFTVIKSAIDRKATTLVGQPLGQRGEWSREQIDQIRTGLPAIINKVTGELGM
jgi:hypothetical protein